MLYPFRVRINYLWNFVLDKLLQFDLLELALLLKKHKNIIQKFTHIEVFILKTKFIIAVKFRQVLNIFNHGVYKFEAQVKILPVRCKFGWLLTIWLDDLPSALNAVERCLEVMHYLSQLDEVLLFWFSKLLKRSESI